MKSEKSLSDTAPPAARAAAQQVQPEPDYWLDPADGQTVTAAEKVASGAIDEYAEYNVPLYAAPQVQQEPVAWRWKKRINCGQGQFIEGHWIYTDFDPITDNVVPVSILVIEPLYAAPPAAL